MLLGPAGSPSGPACLSAMYVQQNQQESCGPPAERKPSVRCTENLAISIKLSHMLNVRCRGCCCDDSVLIWRLQAFPRSYPEAIRQAQESVKAALQDGAKLLEVEFPPASLEAVSGKPEIPSRSLDMRQSWISIRTLMTPMHIF